LLVVIVVVIDVGDEVVSADSLLVASPCVVVGMPVVPADVGSTVVVPPASPDASAAEPDPPHAHSHSTLHDTAIRRPDIIDL
jgi:hypothetical protein